MNNQNKNQLHKIVIILINKQITIHNIVMNIKFNVVFVINKIVYIYNNLKNVIFVIM